MQLREAFARHLDAPSVLCAFQQSLPWAEGYEQCAILGARCRTYLKQASWAKTTLSIVYRLTAVDTPVPRPGRELVLYAKVYLGGRSRDEYAAWVEKGASNTQFAHVPELDTILWRFPHDPSIAQLAQICDPGQVAAHLPERGAQPARVEMIKYQPEAQCTVKVWPNAAPAFFGKTYASARAVQVFERMRHLHDFALVRPDALAVARPLAYSAPIATVWSEDVGGDPLSEALDAGNCAHYMDQTAKGLACVHRSALGSPTRVTIEALRAEARKEIAKLAQVLPAHAAQLGALAVRLEHEAARCPADAPHLIYGDFHLAQLRASAQERVVFLDFDSFAIGDGERDLAEFMMDLRFRAFEPALAEQMAAQLLDSYQRHAGAIVPARLRWHLLYQCVEKLYHAYVQLRAGIDELAPKVLGFAEAVR